MPIAVEFAGVSKRFRLNRDGGQSFQEKFVKLFKPREPVEPFWALREVSFQINQGETIGLVGGNGAGKSTALKLISQIIQPTHGKVSTHGRVTALLELGAGFHPELSGRDNVFLNGAVMGLSRAQIRRKFDSIVAFSELEEFIDEPVKEYSSGMFARLGFAVAVHMEPQILLVDEALSVGDQAFQAKCSERMLQLRNQGITTVLVSHSLETLTQICTRALWLRKGRLAEDGSAQAVADAYLRSVLTKQAQQDAQAGAAALDDPQRPGSGEARITHIQFFDDAGNDTRAFETFQPMTIRLHYRATQRIERPMFGLAFNRVSDGLHLAGPNNVYDGDVIEMIEGVGFVDYRMPAVPWLPGELVVSGAIYDRSEAHCYDYLHHAARFVMMPGGTRQRYGVLGLQGTWCVSKTS